MQEVSPDWFRPQDTSPDANFYSVPRLVAHIDDAAIGALGDFFRTVLFEAPPAPNNGGAGIVPTPPLLGGGGMASLDVLDLMSAFLTHLPPDVQAWCRRVAGLGMNDAEMAANPALTEHVVHSLNDDPRLPYGNAEFDAALCTVSVQYLRRPADVFAEVGRVLRPGGPFLVSFSNRCFPTKATALWRETSDAQHAELVTLFFADSGLWTSAQTVDLSPAPGRSDPLYAVWARRVT